MRGALPHVPRQRWAQQQLHFLSSHHTIPSLASSASPYSSSTSSSFSVRQNFQHRPVSACPCSSSSISTTTASSSSSSSSSWASSWTFPPSCSAISLPHRRHYHQESLEQRHNADLLLHTDLNSLSPFLAEEKGQKGPDDGSSKGEDHDNTNGGPSADTSDDSKRGDEDNDSSRVATPKMMEQLKPRELVAELDRFIIGQHKAKKAVAVAIRNRFRRHQLPKEIMAEVMPKNMLMVGPTGCGKTEISRRVSKLYNAPMIKVEATKFTEVGFHGKDVDTIIKDLVEISVRMTKKIKRKENEERIRVRVEARILEALVGKQAEEETKKTFAGYLRQGTLEGTKVEIEVPIKEGDPFAGGDIRGQLMITMSQLQGRGKKTEKRMMTIAEARPVLEESEMENLINEEDINSAAIKLAENYGIVFIDEIDKIANSSLADRRSSADASAEGVQRDLLPLVEGTVVSTPKGNVRTDHMLFIASGAFHSCKPSDLIPEFQGRFPVRVELDPLTVDDMYAILTKTETNLLVQSKALLGADNVNVEFPEETIRLIAQTAAYANQHIEDIGARRLAMIVERIIEDLSFEAADMEPGTNFTITRDYAYKRVKDLHEAQDFKNVIL